MNPHKRKEDEKFEDYKDRLKRERATEKTARKGTLIWDSSIKDRKTYIKLKHGLL